MKKFHVFAKRMDMVRIVALNSTFYGSRVDREFCNFGETQLHKRVGESFSAYIELEEKESHRVVACRMEVLNDYSSYIAWVYDCGFLTCNRATGSLTDLIGSRTVGKKVLAPLEWHKYSKLGKVSEKYTGVCFIQIGGVNVPIYTLGRAKFDAKFLSLFGLDADYENVIMPFWMSSEVEISSDYKYKLMYVVENVAKMAGFYITQILVWNHARQRTVICGYLVAQSEQVLNQFYAKEIREAKEKCRG